VFVGPHGVPSLNNEPLCKELIKHFFGSFQPLHPYNPTSANVLRGRIDHQLTEGWSIMQTLPICRFFNKLISRNFTPINFNGCDNEFDLDGYKRYQLNGEKSNPAV